MTRKLKSRVNAKRGRRAVARVKMSDAPLQKLDALRNPLGMIPGDLVEVTRGPHQRARAKVVAVDVESDEATLASATTEFNVYPLSSIVPILEPIDLEPLTPTEEKIVQRKTKEYEASLTRVGQQRALDEKKAEEEDTEVSTVSQVDPTALRRASVRPYLERALQGPRRDRIVGHRTLEAEANFQQNRAKILRLAFQIEEQ